MKKFTHMEIRKMWLSFFESKNHKVIESAPLLPVNDDSLLFINAGVTPLKKYFDGSVVPENKRLTNIQKCRRRFTCFNAASIITDHDTMSFSID